MDDSRRLARRRLHSETVEEEIDERLVALPDTLFDEPEGIK